jgi:hypothetical protein
MFDVRHLLSHGASWRRFRFLGFTHICGESRSGRFQLKRITDSKRVRAKLRAPVRTPINPHHHSTQRWVEKCDRSVANSETPQLRRREAGWEGSRRRNRDPRSTWRVR